MSNGPARLTRSLLRTLVLAVLINADLAIAGVQSGCACFSNAYMPAVTGLDIDVPAIAWNSSPGTKSASVNGEAPASTWMPGAVRSGLMMSPAVGSGPRDEKMVIDGAYPILVIPSNSMSPRG